MLYGEAKTAFLGLLNRRDITASLVDTFFGFSIQRIQRDCRVPAMEKVVELQTDGSATLPVPGDLLEFISVHTNDRANPQRLIRTDLQTILVTSQLPGSPIYFHREGSNIYIGPYPPEDTSVFIHYNSDSSSLAADTDYNWMTVVVPTLLIYGALCYAADYYLDDRYDRFEKTYGQLLESITAQAQRDELISASVRPALSFE